MSTTTTTSTPPLGCIILFKDTVNDVHTPANRIAAQYRLQKKHVYTHALKGFATGPIPLAARTQILRSNPEIQSIVDDGIVRTSATYDITPKAANIREGTTQTYTVTTTEVNSGTALYWRLNLTNSGLTSADFVGPVSGSFKVTGTRKTASGQFSITAAVDNVNEPSKTFTVEVRTNSGTSTTPVAATTTTILGQSFTITSPNTTYTEGDSIPITIATTGNTTPIRVYWTVVGTGATPTNAADFTSNVSGFVDISDGTPATVTLQTAFDYQLETSEQFYVSLRQGSLTGTELARTPVITLSNRPSFSFTPPTGFLNETDTSTLTVKVTCLNNPTYMMLLQWSIVGISTQITNAANSADFALSSGDIDFVDGSGSITIQVLADSLTEGNETFYLSLKNGTEEYARSDIYSIADTSIGGSGSYSYTLTTSKTSLTEELIYSSAANASQLTCSVSSTAPVGTVIYWELSGASTPVAEYDFMDTYGYIKLDSTGKASFTVTALNDRIAKTTEPFYIKLRTAPGGQELAISTLITVADATALAGPTGCLNLYTQQTPWGITNIKADAAGLTNLNGLVDIYILDTGCSSGDLNIRDVRSFIANTQPLDGNKHGTHCAGSAAAINNLTGVVGVAPGANIFGYKVLGDNGSGALSDVAAAIDFVCRSKSTNRRTIISMSLGAQTTSTTVVDTALKTAITTYGIVGVVAAGNSSADAAGFSPAHVAEAITVGAYDSANRWASFSNYGSLVDILAPGVSIPSLFSEYGTSSGCTGPLVYSGTSMATPHVAGAVARYLAIAKNAAATPQQVRDAIVATADAKVTGVPTSTTTTRAVNVVTLLA